MPQTLGPLPLGTEIVGEDRTASLFFRLRWEELQQAASQIPTASAPYSDSGLTASLATTVLFTTRIAGMYRITYYIRKTTADGVSSSLTPTFGWTDLGAPLTAPDAALTTDTSTANQSGRREVRADANSDLTIAVTYASNTPGQMVWAIEARVELLP